MVKFINLTPHAITIRDGEREIVVQPSGQVARLVEERAVLGNWDGFPVVGTRYGQVTGLPKPQEGRVYITSAAVMWAAARWDVVAPGPPIRDEAGQVIAAAGFSGHTGAWKKVEEHRYTSPSGRWSFSVRVEAEVQRVQFAGGTLFKGCVETITDDIAYVIHPGEDLIVLTPNEATVLFGQGYIIGGEYLQSNNYVTLLSVEPGGYVRIYGYKRRESWTYRISETGDDVELITYAERERLMQEHRCYLLRQTWEKGEGEWEGPQSARITGRTFIDVSGTKVETKDADELLALAISVAPLEQWKWCD